MLPLGFEPTISAGERPQTYALDRAATGTGDSDNMILRNVILITGKSGLQSITFHQNLATHCGGKGMFFLFPVYETSLFPQTVCYAS
jgi:hypothetical protein